MPIAVSQAIRAAGLMMALIALTSCGTGQRPQGVLLVTVDTLRADHVGAWGYPTGTTPALDAFAAESATFLRTMVPRSQTWPTLASILTSRYPVSHGVRKNGQPLADGTETLAEVLQARGYRCGAFLSNSGQAGWPGFDSLVDARDQDRRLLAEAKGWLRGNARQRFFLWVHLFAPHRPFQPPAPYVERFDPDYAGPIDGSIEQMRAITAGRQDPSRADVRHMLARYDGEVRHFDRMFGELLRTLEELGLDGSTVVALTSDHGEELYARHRYFSHSASIYDTVLHVPLCIRLPDASSRGPLVPGIAESIDLAPTLLALMRIDAPASWRGRALDDAVRGASVPAADHAAFSELEDRVVSVRTRDHRYIHNPDDFDFPMEGGELGLAFPLEAAELYVHRTDPAERHNRAAEEPDVARALRERAERWMEDHEWDDASLRHARSTVPPEVQESLRALGYAN